MNEKHLGALTRVAIIVIGICGLLSCLFWIPMSVGKGALQDLPWTAWDFLIPYVFHWGVSLPCFWLLILAWRVSGNMNHGKLFAEQNAVYVNRATAILIVDILAFLIGNVIFAVLGWNDWLLLQVFVAVIGLVIAVFLYILSTYLMRAAVLQEESDLTV